MKKVLLDNLPKNGKMIDWKNSVGHTVRFIYNDIDGVFKIVSYSNSYVLIKYLDFSPYSISTGNLKQARIGGILMIRTSRQKIDVGDKFKSNKRNLVITDFKYVKTKMKDGHTENRKYYKYTCNVCGWVNGEMLESNLLNGHGCSCCAGITLVEGINDIPTTAPWMVKYFQGGYDEAKLYFRSSMKNFYPICPDCGRVKDKPMTPNSIYTAESIGCICSDGISYPEKFMMNLLKNIKQSYIYQFNKSNETWCKNYRYDFVIQNKHLIIETDGMLHFTDKKCKDTDIIKNRLANDNGYEIVRIDCSKSSMEWIKTSIMNSELPKILNFKEDDIDWLKCHSFGLSNLARQICQYKNENPNSSTSDINKIFQLSISTIIKYLKYGNELGWCTYNKKMRQNKEE